MSNIIEYKSPYSGEQIDSCIQWVLDNKGGIPDNIQNSLTELRNAVSQIQSNVDNTLFTVLGGGVLPNFTIKDIKSELERLRTDKNILDSCRDYVATNNLLIVKTDIVQAYENAYSDVTRMLSNILAMHDVDPDTFITEFPGEMEDGTTPTEFWHDVYKTYYEARQAYVQSITEVIVYIINTLSGIDPELFVTKENLEKTLEGHPTHSQVAETYPSKEYVTANYAPIDVAKNVKNLSTQVTALSQSYQTLSTQYTNHQDLIETLQNTTDDHEESLAQLKSDMYDDSGAIHGLETRIEDCENDLDNKLGINDTAANSDKLGNMPSSHYAKQTDLESISNHFDIDDNFTINGDFVCKGDITCKGDLTCGNLTMTGTLKVDVLNINGITLRVVDNNIYIDGGLIASGNISCKQK